MFKEFFLFEIKQCLKRPLIPIFFLINFLMAFAATASERIVIGATSSEAFVNSPYSIFLITSIMSIVGIFMTTAIVAQAMLRDDTNNYSAILYTAPIDKWSYLGGRLSAAILLSLIPILAVLIGVFVGSISPLVDPANVGQTQWLAYLQAFLWVGLPNTILIGSIAFVFASLSRSTVYTFIGAVCVLMLYVLSMGLASGLENEAMAMLCDPLGINSFQLITKYWTKVEMNSQLIGWPFPFLLNRILWMLVATAFLVIGFLRFTFAYSTKSKKPKPKVEQSTQLVESMSAPLQVDINTGGFAQLRLLLAQVKMEFTGLVKSKAFLILLVLSFFNMLGSITGVQSWFGTGNYPVTYLMVEAIRNSFHLLMLGIILFYSGTIIWREREHKMDEIFDATPFPSSMPALAKFTALALMTAVILLVAMAAGALTQASSGYYNFEWSVYLREFMLYDFLGFLSFIVLSMLIHTFVNNKYLGFFLFVTVAVALVFAPSALNITSNLAIFGQTPSYIYSDMNAWGAYANDLAWFHVYWLLASALLWLSLVLFWVRGKTTGIKHRFRIAAQRFTLKYATLMLSLFAIWAGTAGFLWYQTEVVSTERTEQENILRSAFYEQAYKKYQHIAQPRITKVDWLVEVDPEMRSLSFEAQLEARNKTDQIITEMHFSIQDRYSPKVRIPGARLMYEDSLGLYEIYQLPQPLAPGQSLQYSITGQYYPPSVENELSNTQVVENGTFVGNYQLLPLIGYDSAAEISNAKDRAEHGLSKRADDRKLHANCSHSCSNSYISTDADWVEISAVIGTSKDQIAIAPGTLTKDWQEGSRHYFKYELQQPVLNFFSFVSGRYAVKRAPWTSPDGKQVDLEVYYHPGHEYNVDKMLEALAHSLEYYTCHFSAYPHEQARIIEFPRYQTFAQAFPGTMPYSESMGFIANLNDPDDIDMVYYVVAHEMAHQWWAHQVIGADVDGATMLSESFAQYSALMVMKERYGETYMKRFLRYEMDRYLRGRGAKDQTETALMYTGNQPYIHYRKGSVVMYCLQDYIGEETLNEALQEYAEAVSYQEPPYTTSLDAMTYIRAATPDTLQYLVQDLFEEITLYNNKMVEATSQPVEGGKYAVKLKLFVEKIYADSTGLETSTVLRDYIDIAVFGEGDKVLSKERRLFTKGEEELLVFVDEAPISAAIDPDCLLIDRVSEDNVLGISEEGF